MLASGMPDSAAVRFAALARDTTLRDTLSLAAAGYLGLAHVARGDRDAARTLADSLGALQRKWLFGANLFWRAALLGALGDKAQAVDLLQQAHSKGQRKEKWHYIAALDSLHGYPAFETLVRPRH